MEKQSFVYIRNLDVQAALEEERRRAQPAWELRDGLVEAGCLNQVLMLYVHWSITSYFCKVCIYAYTFTRRYNTYTFTA